MFKPPLLPDSPTPKEKKKYKDKIKRINDKAKKCKKNWKNWEDNVNKYKIGLLENNNEDNTEEK